MTDYDRPHAELAEQWRRLEAVRTDPCTLCGGRDPGCKVCAVLKNPGIWPEGKPLPRGGGMSILSADPSAA